MILRAMVLSFCLLAWACKGPPVEQQIAALEKQFRSQVQNYFQELDNEATEMRDVPKPYYYRYVYREIEEIEDKEAKAKAKDDKEKAAIQPTRIDNFILLDSSDPAKPFKARIRYERTTWVKDENTEPILVETVKSRRQQMLEKQYREQMQQNPQGGEPSPSGQEPQQPQQQPPQNGGEKQQKQEGEIEKPPPPPPPHIRFLYRPDFSEVVVQDFTFHKGEIKAEGILSTTPKEPWKKKLAPWKSEGKIKIVLDEKKK